MGHNPVNHPLRPIYRAIGGLAGLYFVIFGVVGLIVTGDRDLFATDPDRVLGQGANLFWSIVSIVIGAVVLIATLLGRNVDVAVDNYLGWGLLVVGTFALAVLRTDVNIVNFTISTVVVVYLAGLLLIVASFYSKVATDQQAAAQPAARQRQSA
jgi:hypothetical protein